MNAQRLNSVSNEIFSFKRNAENTVKLNTGKSINRDEIVSMGKLATLEFFGKVSDADKNNIVKYNSRLQNNGDFQRSVWVDTVLYCAALANKSVGKEPYTTMAEVDADRGLYNNSVFWNTLAYISQEVITPLYPEVIPAATERLVDWRKGRFGETKLIDIESNDFFVFDDDSWGSVSSKPYQYLYKSQIAITPKPFTAKCKIKWYQDIVDGEAGRYYAAFMRGAYNKMYAIMLERFKAAVASTKYLPTGLTFDSYSASNWNQAVMMAAALNGVDRTRLMAMGTLSALSNVVPTVGTPAIAAGIQGMIGEEWVRNGFLANVAGVDLYETGLAVVPGTQNYNPQFIGLDDATSENIYIMARLGYAPMIGAIADGSPITITFTPKETADMTIDIAETIVFDIAAAFSSKIVKLAV